MAKLLEMICWCGGHYDAREADIKRGWGLSCCKSHAAIRRDLGKPKATRADGVKLKRVRKKDRGANRVTPDYRHNLTKKGSLSQRDPDYVDEQGHIMACGQEGHGQN